MPNTKEKTVEELVRGVLDRLERQGMVAQGDTSAVHNGIFDRVDDAVNAAAAAQRVWASAPKKFKEKIMGALRGAMHAHAEEFARGALEETGMGRLEDKIIKCHNSATATPGIEDLETRAWSGDKGVVYEDYAPYGVIAAVTPSTHPVPVLFNSMIIILAPGNSVVFIAHPSARRISAYAVEIFNRVIQELDGPPDLVCLLREPSMEDARQLFRHPKIQMIAATGGPALVKAAFESGKKVIAAGPGNPPVLVDETADLRMAARHIIEGASFDNNIMCIAEKEVFVVASVYDAFMRAMSDGGAILLTKTQISELAEKVFSQSEKGETVVNRDFIGKNASVLARAVGLSISDDVRLLFGEAEFDCPFVQEEQMMPYLPVVKVKDVEEGIALAVKAEHGYRHTAMIHSNNLDTVTKFAKSIDTDILVVNGPCLAGNGGQGGEGYFSHTIASPTGEGICTPRNFARVRRMALYNSLRMV